MKRSYIYIIVILLTITLVSADFIIGKDLQQIVPLDDTYHTIDDNYVKEASVVGSITIKNEQNSDEKITYEYTIKINGLAGAYRYKYNNIESYLIFAANGEANFRLKSNESIIIYDIPVNLDYVIKQQTENSKYTVKVNDNESNTITGEIDESNSIVFNNATKAVPSKDTKKNSDEDTKKETKKATKKDIPNTGETEIKLTLVLIVSLLIIVCFKIMKVKRFE